MHGVCLGKKRRSWSMVDASFRALTDTLPATWEYADNQPTQEESLLSLRDTGGIHSFSVFLYRA